MTKTPNMSLLSTFEVLPVERAFDLYEQALYAHRQQNPPLSFAGFHAALLEASVGGRT